MPYRNRESLHVWEYYVSNSGEVEWKQNNTTARVGTTDEYYFWRVINDTGKHFFLSPQQWMDFSGYDGEGLEEIVEKWHERYNRLMKTDA